MLLNPLPYPNDFLVEIIKTFSSSDHIFFFVKCASTSNPLDKKVV